MGAREVLVTGSTGFLGRTVVMWLRRTGWIVQTPTGDLRSLSTIAAICQDAGLCHLSVIHLAYPGGDGIGDAAAHPASLAADLLRMDLNVIQACAEACVPKLVCIGSVCAYPEVTDLPTQESSLWLGYPEPVNASYGIVKRTQLALLQAYRQEFGLNGVHLVLANLYGPGDTSGHVIPALITRMRVAQRDGTPLAVWGESSVTRSFLYVEDAAEGVCRALAGYDSGDPLNLVSPVEVSMGQLVTWLADRLGFTGEVRWDATKPTGHRRRKFSITKLEAALGWVPATTLAEGLDATVAWHLAHVSIPEKEV